MFFYNLENQETKKQYSDEFKSVKIQRTWIRKFVCSELDCIIHNEKLIIIKEGKTAILSSAKT